MKVAVTYDENEMVFQHFGHTERFKIYTVEDGKVLSGEVATHVGSMEDLTVSDGASHRKSAWSSSVMNGLSEGSAKAPETDSTEEVMNGNLVVVAVPITFMDEVIGAVFMAQSMTEIMGGMQALTNTLALSLLLVGLLMLPVVLFFASRMVRPITRMRTVALTMAGGDLTARAEDGSNDEYGELGRALNYLSSELGSTISSLQMERNRLQSLINGLSEGIIAVDAKGATTLINPAVYGLLNLQSTDDNVRAAAPDVFAMFDQALSSAQAVKKTVWQGDVALHISVSPLLLQSGEVTGCVGIVSDVTSAERLEQTRRDYVANVSHELRTCACRGWSTTCWSSPACKAARPRSPEASLPRSRCSTSSTKPIPPTPRTISRPSSTTCRKTCRAFGAIRIAPSRCSSCCWITPSSIRRRAASSR